MTGADITKRLRLSADAYERASFKTQAAQLREAADRIEALTEAMQTALHVPSTGDGAAAESMRVILRRALEAK